MMDGLVMALAGAAFGALATGAVLRARSAAERAQAADLQGRFAQANGHEAELAELRRQVSSMRHDVRGMLSPALLVSDRLLTSEDASVRRAGGVMIRTVERVTQRLAAMPPSQPGATSSQQ